MMISWHKVGQKVALLEGLPPWFDQQTGAVSNGPKPDEVCTITHVMIATLPCGHEMVVFVLAEYGLNQSFQAEGFRPVYPQAIDALRKLETPQDERVSEVA